MTDNAGTEPDDRGTGTSHEPFIHRSEVFAALAVVACTILGIGFILVFVGATGNDDPGMADLTETPTSAPGITSAASTEVASGTLQPADVQAITDLARRSIDLLPQDRWPELYDDFVPEFHDRCSLADYTAGGQQAAEDLGESLALLGFKDMQTIEVTGDNARAVIIGELRGQSEYTIEAFFRREPGGWKFVPAPGTTGCSAFNRLTE